MIYETDFSVLRYLSALVDDCGYPVQAGVSAITDLKHELRKSSPPDLAIISTARPESGLDVLRAISPVSSPIILCVDGEIPETKMRLEEMGVLAVVRRTTDQIGCLIGAISRSRRGHAKCQ